MKEEKHKGLLKEYQGTQHKSISNTIINQTDVIRTLDRERKCVAVYTNHSKVSILVDHQFLLNKILKSGMRRKRNILISCNISDTPQYI